MSFDLPNLTVFVTVFFAAAAFAIAFAAVSVTKAFAENRAVRVRRHESVGHYYGHLVLGH
jgi:hypothetical protein